MAAEFSKKTKAFAYRYNQANPTSGSTIVGHAAENWMMFKGTNTGCVFGSSPTTNSSIGR